jgi:hypothetical protein
MQIIGDHNGCRPAGPLPAHKARIRVTWNGTPATTHRSDINFVIQ